MEALSQGPFKYYVKLRQGNIYARRKGTIEDVQILISKIRQKSVIQIVRLIICYSNPSIIQRTIIILNKAYLKLDWSLFMVELL